jgi:inward rectifier potassium channel
MFRMANARSSQIVEAHVSVMLVRTQRTAEGDVVRRLSDLRLLRAQHALFALTWTAVHPIDEASPLRGATPESLAADDAVVIISFSGFDENLAATIHARETYPADRILFGRRLVDVIVAMPDGTRVIDYRKFHDIEPEQP